MREKIFGDAVFVSMMKKLMEKRIAAMKDAPEKPSSESKTTLGEDRAELMESKKERLGSVRDSVREMFGTDGLPKELVEEMIGIRKDIKDDIARSDFLDRLGDGTDIRIRALALSMIRYKDATGDSAKPAIGENGDPCVPHEDGSEESFGSAEQEMLESLRMYFDAYRLAHNAAQFRGNVKTAEDAVVAENLARTLNFYSEDEKESALLDRVFEKYERAGFEKKEIRELIRTCELERLDTLEIHDLKILSKIGDIFSRFVSGDRSKYVGLSAALMIPAFLDGYAPMFLADTFRATDGVDLTQLGLFALLTSASAGLSALFHRQFKDFLDENFSKEGGFGEYIVGNVSEFPGDEVGKFGMERIKQRVAWAKSGYEQVLRDISFDIVPAVVTLLTSSYMLYERSPVLAGGTAAGAGMMMIVDRYVGRKGKFLEKERKARESAEEIERNLNELLGAHMEVILSGEKERFMEDMEVLLSRERVALSDRTYMRVVRNKANESMRLMNYLFSGVAAYFSGGAMASNFVASLLSSGNLTSSLSNILAAKHSLLQSFRDIVQMEIMFNGYAEEEKEKEEGRIGMSELSGRDIRLRGVGVGLGGRRVLDDIDLDIPAGSMVSLEGASGAGKTTLMKVLSGYYKPTEGSVEVGGTDVDKIKKSGSDSIYGKIAYLSQFPYILEDTVRNNVAFGIAGEVADDEIRDVLSEVGLNARFSNLNERLKGGRGDSGTSSGGETSRIGLARTILKLRKNGSHIVFLDEPTASVDDETAEEIARIINEEKRKNPEATFISISHDRYFRGMLESDMVVKMKDGTIRTE